VWLAIATVGGIAAILGSLIVLGCLVLWLIPAKTLGAEPTTAWQNKLKLMAIALVLSLSGIGILAIVPFPIENSIGDLRPRFCISPSPNCPVSAKTR
jgi:Na+/melibiose symporter-like transporter